MIFGKVWIPGLGLGKSEGVVRDAKEVLRKTRCLVRVGVGKSDGCHESNPSFHTVTKVPSICRVKAVFMMGLDKCIKKAQNHNAILKASHEHKYQSRDVTHFEHLLRKQFFWSRTVSENNV